MLSGLSGYLIGAGIIVFVWLASIMKAVLWGAGRERDKQLRSEAKARDMADEVENDIGAMTPEQQRAELRAWAKK